MTLSHLPALDDIDIWRELFGPRVRACALQPLSGGNSPSRLWRVRLTGTDPQSVVVKQSMLPWSPEDPHGFRREAFVYQHLLDGAHGVAPRLLHSWQSGDGVRLVLEDLSDAFAFRSAAHAWTAAELRIVAETFARLHGATQQDESLADPVLMAAPDSRWPVSRLRQAADILDGGAQAAERGWQFVEHAEATLRTWPVGGVDIGPSCLVHSDFNAGNVALSTSAARLLDWHIAAGGSAGFDFANLFFQPWDNQRSIDVGGWFDAVDAARNDLRLPPWHGGDRGAAMQYCIAWCALSYLPALAAQIGAGPLSGWWLHTAVATHHALRCKGAL